MQETMASLCLDATIPFERVLLGEMRHMQRNGSIAVVTTRINPRLADLLLRFRRMGPYVRLYIVRPMINEEQQTLLHYLQCNDVEVRIVHPADCA
ncbi:MAG: hypothetical protein RR482_08000, partial [Clostridia bacterium]